MEGGPVRYPVNTTIRVLPPLVLLVAVLWTTFGLWAYREQQDALNNRLEIMVQLNSAVAEHTNSLLKLAETVFRAGRIHLRAAPDGSPQLDALANELRQQTNGLMDLLMSDRAGHLRYLPPKPDMPVVPLNPKRYKAALAETPRGLHLGTPLIGELTGEWLVPMVEEPSHTEDGAFLFVVLRASKLIALHDTQRLRPDGTAGLIRADGVVLTRAPFDEHLMGIDLSSNLRFKTVWLPNHRGTYIDPPGRTDAVPRLVSFIRLKDFPVYVHITQERGAVLASWRTRVLTVAAGGILATLVALLSGYAILRGMNQLRESHQRFVDIAATASDVVWEVDPEWRFTFISDRHRDIMRSQITSALGRTFPEVGWVPANGEARTAVARVLKHRQAFFGILLNGKDEFSRDRTISVSGRPFFGRDNRFLGYRGAASDVTETLRQEQEKALRAEREAQSNKLEALGQLAGGIAHDFNNLLGAILGFAHFLVQDSPPDSPQRGYAERIVLAGQRGRDLVKQILTFSRRTSGTPADLDLAKVIPDCLQLLYPTIPSTTHLIENTSEADLHVTADRSQLGQVIINLCINASDALEGCPGDVRVSVDTVDMDRAELKRLPVCVSKPTPAVQSIWAGEDGVHWLAIGGITAPDNVAIRVEDTGPGIRPEHFPMLFDLFFTTKGSGGGTGLGLPVVLRVVTEHGGAILVQSRQGSGTTFEVILPRANPYGLEAATEEVEPETAAPGPARRTGTIMVVDDDGDFCAMLQEALERVGHDVVSASDPAEGLQAVIDDPALWDLVITDQTMPGMTGLDLVARLKAKAPDLRCIICTGYGAILDEDTARAAGADAICSKPLNLDAFVTLLDTILDQNGRNGDPDN